MRPCPVFSCVPTDKKARNILLVSLIVDDVPGATDILSWNLYYHFRIDEHSLALLRTQAQKLHSISTSPESWRESRYGKLIRLCDRGSLEKLRDIWHFYGLERQGIELSRFDERLDATIRKSNQHKARLGAGMILTGFRSSSPAHLHSIDNSDALHKHYWEHGSTDFDPSAHELALHANPMFMSQDDNVVLHYGTDPLLGFHLATAYAPLTTTSPLYRSTAELTRLVDVVEGAKIEFRAWAKSLRNCEHTVILRFFVGDALAFCHSLQQRSTAVPPSPAHWYRDRFHFEPLILDGEDCTYGKDRPSGFTVIDTSNLIDHVGALNLLVAAAPLLKHDISATLYTEKLVRSDSTYTSLFDNLLCGPLPTVAMLLGLTLVDSVTNTSAISTGDEILLDTATRQRSKTLSESGQLFTRMSWKRPIRMHDGLTLTGAPRQIHFDPASLAAILYHIYSKMFENEDVTQLMSNVTMLKLQKFSTPTYQRASFAALISILRTSVIVDWEKTIDVLLGLMETNVSLLMTRNYIQELYTWLHLLGIYSVDILKTPANRFGHDLKTKDLRDWKNIPPVVCVTFEVPRENLEIFTGRDLIKAGTPPVHCLVQGSSNGKPWQNVFGAVQIGFGKVETCGTPFSDSFEVSICEDRLAWSGKSPLLASFYAPAWMLLLQPRTALVEFGLQSTPQSTHAYIDALGLQLSVYKTTLADSEHVYVSKNLPNQSKIIDFHDLPICEVARPNSKGPTANTTITASIDMSTAKIVSLAGRVDIISDDGRTALRSGGQVNSTSRTPF